MLFRGHVLEDVAMYNRIKNKGEIIKSFLSAHWFLVPKTKLKMETPRQVMPTSYLFLNLFSERRAIKK